MTTKQFWTATALSTLICLAIAGTLLKPLLLPLPGPQAASPPPIPIPAPPQPPTPDVPVAIAAQKAKLRLADGRTATFRFATTGGSLICTAAVGLDQILTYNLVPAAEPPTPDPAPAPNPSPAPDPTPSPPNPTKTAATMAIIVYDAAAPRPWEDSAVAAAARASGISILPYDHAHAQDVRNAPGWISYCASKGLLYAVLVDDGGKVLWEGKADCAAALTAALNAFSARPKTAKSGHYEQRCNGRSCQTLWVEEQ